MGTIVRFLLQMNMPIFVLQIAFRILQIMVIKCLKPSLRAFEGAVEAVFDN